MLLISLIFSGMFIRMCSNQSKCLEQADKGYITGDVYNIDQFLPSGKLAQFLVNKGYLHDVNDARFIADSLISKLKDHTLKNLGSLNKKAFHVSASAAETFGGENLKLRVKESRIRLGYNEDIATLYKQKVAQTHSQPNTDGSLIEVAIDGSNNVKDVLVQLKEYYFADSIDNLGNLVLRNAQDSIVGYAKTDADGIAYFKVKKGKYYSVLPIRLGYEYGRSKGTTRGPIEDDVTRYSFKQEFHHISLFDSNTYSKIKQDQSLTVRTPAQYKDGILISIVLFLLSWWILYACTCIMDKRKKAASIHTPIFLLMSLTGIGLLVVYSIFNPLTDEPNGEKMAYGITIGVFLMFVTSTIDWTKFYTSKYFDLLTRKVEYWRWKGIIYFLLAVMISVILWIFGSGPEGSDAHVNLFGIQPSEFSKYLIVIFMASFFAQNSSVIQQFAEKEGRFWLWLRFLRVIGLLILMLIILGFYVICLSDMGPALVLLITFILLYSVSRKDTIPLLFGLVSFMFLMWMAYQWNNTPTTIIVAALIWFGLWIVGGLVLRKQIYESAIFMNVVLLVFCFGGQILTSIGLHEGQRILNRTAMAWSGVWENNVPGGDQIAQGIWGLASGGFGGQGLSKGCANLIPACHTDMVFESTGEILGYWSLILIVVCFCLFSLYCIRIARNTAHCFAFFLISSIAIVISVQFFVIVMGSLGLIPLTGVSVPFLSFGKSSMIANLAACGIIISLSRLREKAKELVNADENIKGYDNIQLAIWGAFVVLSVFVIGKTTHCQILARDSYLVTPAFVVNTDGAFFTEYNPRIAALMRKLDVGNIYDRNGLLLATSNTDSLLTHRKSLMAAGISSKRLEELSRLRLHRFYPFESHLLFMLGDVNTGVVRNESDLYPRGYVAEYRHLPELRGFGTEVKNGSGDSKSRTLTSALYHASPFLPSSEETFTLPLKDYSDPNILDMLKDGIDGSKVEEWNSERGLRDIKLTIDAKLQMRLQEQMKKSIKEDARLNYIKKLRASVVVLNAGTGELLCSANYPLPNEDTIRMYSNYSEKDRNQWAYTEKDLGTTFYSLPGSTAKVVSAMAAFKKEGDKASKLQYLIREREAVGHDRTGNTNMHDAIVYSSNSYFVNLVHDRQLYPLLAEIYQLTGARINAGIKLSTKEDVIPYYYYLHELTGDTALYNQQMKALGDVGCSTYQNYKKKHLSSSMKHPEWGIAWGQHHIYATPLDMARVISIIANNGQFVPTSYVMGRQNQPISIIPTQSAKLLQNYLKDESTKHRNNGTMLPKNMGGKTGTPIRNWHYLSYGKVVNGGGINDGWYICYLDSSIYNYPLAIAVRLERVGLTSPQKNSNNSGSAVRFIEKAVIPVLKELCIIK